MENPKRIVLFLIITFLFIMFQTPVTSAQDDDPSGYESTDTSAWYYTDDITYLEDTNYVQADDTPVGEVTADTSQKNKDKKAKEESSEIEAPESMAMAMTSGGSSGSNSSGALSVPEAVTVSQVGAAAFSYPIAVPPGRNGLQPNIALSYSSYNGNGWLGVGWDLDLGSIKRSTKNGLNYSASDFIAGGSELVSNSSWGTNYYCAKIEGAFTKYYFNAGSNYWIAYAKDGTKYYYGQTAGSRVTNTYGTYSWSLDRVEDTNGNYMTVSYTTDQNQLYPSQISYTGNSGLSPNKTVEFELENRTDIIRSYKTKSLVTTSKHLKTITVKVGTTTVYKYSLAYEYSPGNGRSRLVDITRVDPDNPNNTLPPTQFSWIDGGNGDFGPTAPGSPVVLAGYATGAKIAFGDINGDGREDFIKYIFSAWPIVTAYPYLANDSGGFTPQTSIDLGICPFPVPDIISAALGDINGDGWADIVFDSYDGYFKAYLSNGNGTFDSGHSTSKMSSYLFFYLADLDGDGVADLVTHSSTEGKVWTQLANGDGTFGTALCVYSNSNTVGGTIHLGDVNGDGIPDLCMFNTVTSSNSYVRIYLGNGSGAFNTTSYWSLLMGSSGTTRQGAFADVNGDGLSDFVIDTSATTISVYISTGTGMTGPYTTALPGYLVGDLIGAADLNDDGMADVITDVKTVGVQLFYKSNGDGTFAEALMISDWPNSRLADINGDGRPDLISYNSTENSISYRYANGEGAGDQIETITTPLGGTTSITYGNNTDISNNMVPFTLHPVKEIETNGGYGGEISLTSYAYSGAFYDYEERDFRGFDSVIQTNPDNTTIKTYYELDDNYIKGRPLAIEMKAPGESYPFSKTTYTWGTYTISGTDANFVKLTNKKVDINDDHDSTFDEHTYENYDYDNTHGGVLSKWTSGSDGRNIGIYYTYANKGTWVWRKASEQWIVMPGILVRQTNYTYESTTGNLLTKAYVYEGQPFYPTEIYTYDSYGNIATYKDPKGAFYGYFTEYTYDSTYTHITGITYPTTGGVTHSVAMTYNILGKLYSETDENNKTTYHYYDDFGRLYRVVYPDGGQTEYTYVNPTSTAPAYIKTSVLEYTGSYLNSYQYVDGFGRAIMEVSKGIGSNNIVTIANYDNMGRVYLTEGPYLTGNFSDTNPFSHTVPSLYPTVRKTFDNAGRVLTISTPKG